MMKRVKTGRKTPGIRACTLCGLVVSAWCTVPSLYASVVGPYTNDPYTVYLFHLDEAAGSGTAAWEGGGSGTGAYCVDSTAAEVTDVLGAAGYFGGAANMAGRGIGIDAQIPSNGFDYTDRINFSTLISAGQFTLEALVKPNSATLSGNGEIWCMDDSDSSRGFQFRLNASGQLEWHPINLGGAGPVTASVGTLDPAIWYHAAITYSNGVYTMYWTPVDGSHDAAQVLHTWTSTLTTTSLSAPLVLGNEGREYGGMSEAFPGLIDEARISSIARSAGEFIFTLLDTDEDGLPDDWEQQIIDADPNDAITTVNEVLGSDDFDHDGLTNEQEFRLGLNPTVADSAETDTDSDYLPDLWEFAQLDSLDYNSYDDNDSDGYNNQAERMAGTDPMLAAEHPDWTAPGVAFLRDTEVAADACLMGGGIYGRAINGVSFQDQVLMTFDGYQYTAYYDTAGSVQKVCIARRTVSDASVGAWEVFQTDSEFTRGDEGSWDAHNVVAFGICPEDGTLHVAWDHHGHTLRYRRSVVGLCTTNKAAWGAGMLNAEQNWLVDAATPEYDVTYPQFITTPNGGLALDRRYHSSGNGDQYLQFYNPASGTWNAHIEFINRSGNYNGSTSRCPYLNGFDFGPAGTIHVTWTWREGATGTGNHDLCYAYSEDNGVTWKNNAGTVIADTSLGQTITLDTAGIIFKATDQHQLIINQQAQCVDNDGRVHVLMLHRREDPGYAYPNVTADDYSTLGVAYYHYFRNPDSGEWTQRRIPPDVYQVGSRPCIGYDATGNIYAAFLSYATGTGVVPGYTYGKLVIASASKASDYTDWKIQQALDQDFDGEPLLDQARLLSDNILSVYIQEHATYVNGDGIPTPLHVIDFMTNLPGPVSGSGIALSFMGQDVVISTYGAAGSNYQLQVTTDLMVSNGWNSVGSPVDGLDSTLAFPDTAGLAGDNAFYRIGVTPAP